MDVSLDMVVKILKATYYVVMLGITASRTRKEYTRWRMTRRKSKVG